MDGSVGAGALVDGSAPAGEIGILRHVPGKMSVYDILQNSFSAVEKPQKKWSTRFNSYCVGDSQLKLLKETSRHKFEGQGQKETPVVTNHDQLDRLLYHYNDHGKALDFVHKFKKEIESSLGERKPPDLPSGMKAEDYFLQHCHGFHGSNSIAARLKDEVAFQRFKERYELVTATAFVTQRKATRPCGTITKRFFCLRGGKPNRVKRVALRNHTFQRAAKQTLKCECPAYIDEYITPEGVIDILLVATHSGHEPGSVADVRLLPVHPLVRNKAKELSLTHSCKLTVKQHLTSFADQLIGSLMLPYTVDRGDRRFFPTYETLDNIIRSAQAKQADLGNSQAATSGNEGKGASQLKAPGGDTVGDIRVVDDARGLFRIARSGESLDTEQRANGEIDEEPTFEDYCEGSRTFLVDLQTGHCDCPFFVQTKSICEHIFKALDTSASWTVERLPKSLTDGLILPGDHDKMQLDGRGPPQDADEEGRGTDALPCRGEARNPEGVVSRERVNKCTPPGTSQQAQTSKRWSQFDAAIEDLRAQSSRLQQSRIPLPAKAMAAIRNLRSALHSLHPTRNPHALAASRPHKTVQPSSQRVRHPKNRGKATMKSTTAGRQSLLTSHILLEALTRKRRRRPTSGVMDSLNPQFTRFRHSGPAPEEARASATVLQPQPSTTSDFGPLSLWQSHGTSSSNGVPPLSGCYNAPESEARVYTPSGAEGIPSLPMQDRIDCNTRVQCHRENRIFQPAATSPLSSKGEKACPVCRKARKRCGAPQAPRTCHRRMGVNTTD